MSTEADRIASWQQAAVNCVDCHVTAGRAAKVALHFAGEPLGDTTSLQNQPCVPEIQRICQGLGTAPVKEHQLI